MKRESQNKRERGGHQMRMSCIMIARRQGALLYKGQIDTMRHVKTQENGSRRETPW